MPQSLPPALVKYHRGNNQETAAGWAPFSEHRSRLTDLTLAEGSAGGALALLGAGNCNDVDLERLAEVFDPIHLVDLDDEAVRRARARQPPAVARKLVLRAPLDLSGALAELPRFAGRALTPAQLDALSVAAAARVLAALPERFDVVVSACLLSQLMHGCYVALGEHPQLEAIGRALGVAHVRSLVGLARPGGRAVLVTDVVSSQSYPLEELWGERAPRDLLAQLEASGNFLSGTAPAIVRSIFAGEKSSLAEPPHLVEPWLWRMGGELTLLVYAMVARRRDA